MFSAIAGKLGYETLPSQIAGKSFYDLQAALPGKEKVYDFVSRPISAIHTDETEVVRPMVFCMFGSLHRLQANLKGKPVLIVNTASKW